MDKLVRTLQFLRLIDADNNLSLTNLAVMLTLVSVLLKGPASVEDLGMFIATLVSYQVKRWVSQQAPTAGDDLKTLQEAVSKLQSSVTAVQLGQTIRKS